MKIKLNEATIFAHEAHRQQKYGDQPYFHHLKDVVETLAFYGFSEDCSIVISGWLHDVVEDTSVSLGEIKRLFGENVAQYVNAVSGEGKNRKERNESIYRKLNEFRDAIPLKLADRIANVKNCIKEQSNDLQAGKSNLLEMYSKEYPKFKERLFSSEDDIRVLDMWKTLDELLST